LVYCYLSRKCLNLVALIPKMTAKKLKAFNGDFNEKLIQLSRLSKWLKAKQAPKSAIEMTNAIFNPIREFKKAECAIEDFRAYPKVLGLPLWLGRLNGTIDHHNSKPFDFKHEGFEYTYYKDFLISCKEGIDYSKMLYRWQLFLLKDFIPGAAEEELIKEIVGLHEKAAKDVVIEKKEWHSAQMRLKNKLDELKAYESAVYPLRRTAYLSVEEVIDIENLWTSSAEAAAEAKIRHLLQSGTEEDKDAIKESVWKDIRNQLLKVLREWH
jgi:hypothetical protein